MPFDNTDYSQEIYKLLKLTQEQTGQSLQDQIAHELPKKPSQNNAQGNGAGAFNLPVVDFTANDNVSLADQVVNNVLGAVKLANRPSNSAQAQQPVASANTHKSLTIVQPSNVTKVLGRARRIMVYPAIFVVSFAFFYVLLNFSSLVGQVNAWFTKPQEEEILQEDLVPFTNWINGYFFAVQDRQALDPNNDIDKDGLSNLDEYTLKTNPTIADSDNDGSSDGIEVINSTNPWGQGGMTNAQKKLRDEIDIIKVNNRISYNALSLNPTLSNESQIDFDLSKPATLSIPRLNMQVPLIWSNSPADFETDLTKGVVHYPGTSMPGQKGTMYVSGHSSDYLWKRHPYKQIFARLNALEIGDDIFVDVYGLDGKVYNFRYRVSAENVFNPDDQTQFVDNSTSKINLSTCWPIGSQKDRYVVSAELVNL